MNPVLYYKIYKKGIDEQVINKYTELIEPREFYYLTANYIREN